MSSRVGRAIAVGMDCLRSVLATDVVGEDIGLSLAALALAALALAPCIPIQFTFISALLVRTAIRVKLIPSFLYMWSKPGRLDGMSDDQGAKSVCLNMVGGPLLAGFRWSRHASMLVLCAQQFLLGCCMGTDTSRHSHRHCASYLVVPSSHSTPIELSPVPRRSGHDFTPFLLAALG